MLIEPSTTQVLHDRFGIEPHHVEKALSIATAGNLGAYADIFFEDGITEALTMKSGILEDVSINLVNGVGVYVVIGDKTGFAFADDVTPNNLFLAAKQASAIAEFGKQMPAQSIGKPTIRSHNLYPITESPTDVPLLDKINLLRMTEAEARKVDTRVSKVISILATQDTIVIIANTMNGGTIVHDRRPLVRLRVTCIASDGTRTETGSSGGGGRVEYAFLAADEFWAKHARLAANQAVRKLTALPAPVGQKSVVLGAGWPGVLVHEAVGHGLEGDFNRKKTSAFSGRIGERVAAPGVNIVDDGTMHSRRGSLNVDDQGVATTRTVLIEDGILRGYLQDQMNATLMGTALTGNGRRESYRHRPMPRMTNTFMAGGKHSLPEMIASVKDGLFAEEFGGGQVDITSGKFVFELASARRIVNGKLEEYVRGATLIGDGPTALTKIKMIGDESEVLDAGVGMCGKGGQTVPVCVGMPSALIDDVTVGGTG